VGVGFLPKSIAFCWVFLIFCGLIKKLAVICNASKYIFFDVLLTVLHLSIFIWVFNQLDAQNLVSQ